MGKFFFALFLFSLSVGAGAEDTICPISENAPWDKMKESDFTRDKVQEKIRDIEKVFRGEMEVAVEFIWQANNVIEGGFLLHEVHRTKNSPEYSKYAKESFCQFMSERAYLAH